MLDAHGASRNFSLCFAAALTSKIINNVTKVNVLKKKITAKFNQISSAF